MKNLIHHILYSFFILLISIPLLFDFFGNEKSLEPLHGAYITPIDSDFTLNKWFNRTYQENKDSVFKYNLKLRPTLIRLYNQIDYSLFGKTNMSDLLIGKENFMFSLGWTKSRAGKVSLNDTLIDEVAKKLKQIEELMQANNQFFMFLIPPSKEELFCEYLPDMYKIEGSINDYKILLSKLDKYDVSYTDLKPYYQKLMTEKVFPVYSKTSVHWTLYGAHYTTLMLLDRMNTFFDNTMPQLNVTDLEISPFRDNDGDQENTLNLFYRIDESNFAYPKYEVSVSNDSTFKPKVITIGDSYYWGILGSWQMVNLFSETSKYLYYYNTVYPNIDAPSYPISELNISYEFSTTNALIIINSSHNLNGFPYGLERDLDSIINALTK